MVIASRRRLRRLLSLPNKLGCQGQKPLYGAEGTLDTVICSENRMAVAIDGFSRTLLKTSTLVFRVCDRSKAASLGGRFDFRHDVRGRGVNVLDQRLHVRPETGLISSSVLPASASLEF